MNPETRLIFRAFKYNVLIGIICFFSISLMKNNHALNLFTQIVLPIFIVYRLTRKWLPAITLLAINDIYLSYTGLFFGSLDLPYSRSILFVATLILFSFSVLVGSQRNQSGLSSYYGYKSIILYGLLFPFSLVIFSLAIGNASLDKALGDVLFIFPVLMYFPIARLVKSGTSTLIGWVLAIAFIHSLQSLTISLGPRDIAVIIYQNYSNLATDRSMIDHFIYSSGFLRNASTAFILSFVGIFTGLVILNQKTLAISTRILAAVFSLICLAPMVMDALRGPLLSLLIIVGIITISSLFANKGIFKTMRLLALGIIFIIIVRIVLIQYVPGGYERFNLYNEGAEVFVGNDRLVQHYLLLEEYFENPWFGRGVGARLREGYERASSGTDFELQYHMFLYKMGSVFFIIFMVPYLWVFSQLLHTYKSISYSNIIWLTIFKQSLLYSICGTCIAAITNPYLKTGYLTLSIAMFYVIINEERKRKVQLEKTNPDS